MSLGSPPRSTAFFAVLLLVLAGWALRWHGIGWGLPHQTYRDGMVISTQVELLRAKAVDPGRNEFWGYYPHLMARIVAALPIEWEGAPARPLDLEAHLARASEPWLAARKLSVLLSLLAIPGAYWVARRFTSFGWALFAAALVTFSILHLSFAQQEKPHGPISGTVVLAVVAAVRLRRRPTPGNHVLAILAAALAVSTLQNGAAALLSLAAAGWFVLRGGERRHLAWSLPLALAVLAGSVWFFYPFEFDRFASAPPEDALSLGGHPVLLDKLNFAGTKNMLLTLYLFEPVMLALALVGGAVYLARLRRRRDVDPERRRDFAVIAAFALPYGLVLCAYADSWDRFLMPLLPFLAAVAAYGAEALARKLPSAAWRAGLAAVLLVEPAAAAWQMARVRAADDTQTQVAHWIGEHATSGERIYVWPYLDLPLFYSEVAIAESPEASEVLTWMAYQARLAPELELGPRFTVIPPRPLEEERAALGSRPLEALRERGADLVVIQTFSPRYRYKFLLRLLDELREQAELVFVAEPEESDGGSSRVWIREKMTLAQVPTWLRLFGERCVGTRLEIYRLRRDG